MAFTTVQYIRMVAVNVASSTTTQYTVPASRQDVVKCVTVANSTAAALTFFLQFNGINLFNGVSIPASQTLSWTGTIVLNAAETIVTNASGTGLQLTISGLESQ